MTVVKTLIVLAVVGVAGALLFIYSGVYYIGADRPHLGVVRWVLSNAQERAVAVRAGSVDVPSDLGDPERILRGGWLYRGVCEPCHLGPGINPTPYYRGLLPTPPRLSEVAEKRSAGYVYWATKHGIKSTGMPAFGETTLEESLWDIVAFTMQLDEMTAEEYTRWAEPDLDFSTVAESELPAEAPEERGRLEPTGSAVPAPAVLVNFTAEQMLRGAQVYQQSCASCHGEQLLGRPSPPLRGEAFREAWINDGRSVERLYHFISSQMPQGNPAGLSQYLYLDVTAYILSQNGFAPTGDELKPGDFYAPLNGSEE